MTQNSSSSSAIALASSSGEIRSDFEDKCCIFLCASGWGKRGCGNNAHVKLREGAGPGAGSSHLVTHSLDRFIVEIQAEGNTRMEGRLGLTRAVYVADLGWEGAEMTVGE